MTPLGGLAPHWLWLIAGLVLAILELVVPGVFLIWLGIAAALTGAATLALGLPLVAQFALFAVVALAAVYAARRWVVRNPIATDDPLLNDRTARLIGRTVTVVVAIDGGEGRVRVGDGEWNARGPDAPSGAQVRIVGAAGGWLTVEPV